ncbi:hypothetical protein, partial [Streptobacillus moniliformis]|uniref:hypothetical protein n=1 Tax=Streptobacillus moniliformis TaxID=34105 RepID=UPI0012DAD39F
MLEEVDPRGFIDGYSFILKDNINIIKSDTEYLKGIEILMNVNSKENILNSYVFDHKEIKLEGENIFDDILKKLTGNKLPVTLLLPESEKVFGYISEISDDFVEVEYFEKK